MKLDGIGTRIALAAILVAGLALAIVAIGVMQAGGDQFAALMAAAGHGAEEARRMFDASVSIVVLVAAVVAIASAVVLAMILAHRIARPIERLAQAAARTAEGDLRTLAPEEGPAEVRALASAYNVMVDRLAEQEAIRREFVVNASHELRTPLTNLQGYLEALRDGVLPPDPATFDSLREEVDRLGRLAASLDLLAGGPADRPMPEDLDLVALVRSATDLAAPAFARRSIAVELDVPTAGQPGHSTARSGRSPAQPSQPSAQPVLVRARADELTQVIANLLQNAARYTPSGGSVRVALVQADGEVVVRVTNSGPGIPPPDLPRVWERFYRVDKSRDRATGGAGIGLAIVKRLVEEAGGRVGASSESGSTTFWFALPGG